MKIRKLFLKAFGPFDQSVLDFSGPANLHLILALRGRQVFGVASHGRLRYGIPMRSKDDFVHDFKNMLIGGCFEDVAGGAVGLARRKGNKDTLLGANPDTGE